MDRSAGSGEQFVTAEPSTPTFASGAWIASTVLERTDHASGPASLSRRAFAPDVGLV